MAKELLIASRDKITCPFCFHQFDSEDWITGLEADDREVQCGCCEQFFSVNKRVTFSYQSIVPLENPTPLSNNRELYVLSEDLHIGYDHEKNKCWLIPLSLDLITKQYEAELAGIFPYVRDAYAKE